MTVKHSNEVEAKNVAAGKDTTIQVLISSQEGPTSPCGNSPCCPAEGCRATQTRWNMSNTFCADMRRSASVRDLYEVKAGDTVFIPAGEVHFYENIGTEPFEFLCIIPNKEDRITIVDC